MTATRTPAEEVKKRLAEAGVSLKIAGQAVGLEDHRRMLASHAKRVDQSNAAMARAMGMEDLVQNAGDDDMGNIIVTGDINLAPGADVSSLPWVNGNATPAQPASAPAQAAATPQQPAQAQQPASQSAASSALPSWVKTAAVLAAGAATGGVGAPIAGAALDWMFPDSPPAVVQSAEPTPAVPGIDHGGVTIEPFKVGE